jgi:hypothetical protein
VCREQPRIQALDHVLWSIDAFADFSHVWTVENALKTREPRLVARVAQYIIASPEVGEAPTPQACARMRCCHGGFPPTPESAPFHPVAL